MRRSDSSPETTRFRLACHRLWRNNRGSIAILTAICLPALIGAAAMGLDVARLFLTQSVAQRIADQSAVAAAFAYSQSNNSATAAAKAATSLATVNGAGSATVTTSMVASPSSNGHTAARVVVQSTVLLSGFGQVLTGRQGVPVSAEGYAEITVLAPTPCILALGSGGISTSSGTTVTATGCEIASNGSIIATGGSRITAKSIYATGAISAPISGGSIIATSPTANQIFPNSSTQPDPFDAGTVFSRFSTVAALTMPGFPPVGSAPSGGGALTCNSGTLTVPSGPHGALTVGAGCTIITFSGGAETDIGATTIPADTILNFNTGIYKIKGLYLTGGNVTFNLTGAVTLEIWNGLNVSNCVTLAVRGPATYNIQGGITSDSCGEHVMFDNSNYASNGTLVSTFHVLGGISLAGGYATFPDGDYIIYNSGGPGLYLGSTAQVTFGNGSFIIGGSAVGGGITIQTSARLTIGSQLNGGSVFEIPGTYTGTALNTASASALTIGSFSNLDINGPVTFSGDVILGGGTYTVNGPLSACASGGTISGASVSIIAAGTFCFGAGYGVITLTAPTVIDNATAGAPSTIALASRSFSPSAITSGAIHTGIVGAIYLPNSALTTSGGGALSGTGSCLQVVAAALVVGGSGILTSCSNLGSSAAISVGLAQ